ncbi:MAG: hypothetical protein HYX47_17475 [Burkholderiales bacterium]|nr:hypothetical protein [Burkholderiales bacterium]
MKSTNELVAEKLAAWQAAQAELAALEQRLGEAMSMCARMRGEPPRQLIIEAELKREAARKLFDIAVEALDAHSAVRTGHTNFGELR